MNAFGTAAYVWLRQGLVCSGAIAALHGCGAGSKVTTPQRPTASAGAGGAANAHVDDSNAAQRSERAPIESAARCGSAPTLDLNPIGSPLGGALDRLVAARRKIGKIRGWDLELPLVARRVGESEQIALLGEEMSCLQPEAVSHAFDAALSMLGLLPAGFDTRRALLDQYRREPRSVYLTSRRLVAVPQAAPDDTLERSLVHELAHVYQDSLYRLGERIAYAEGGNDRTAAYHSFAEGEALLLDLESQSSPWGKPPPSSDELAALLEQASLRVDLPRVLQLSIVAPYADGYQFVSYLRKLGGWQLVDQIWKRGLASSSELLHPERWVTDCLTGTCPPVGSPSRLSNPVSGDPGNPPRLAESVGEQGLRVVLETVVNREAARRLSAGYLADDLAVVARAGLTEVAWQLRLERADSAQELLPLLAQALSPNDPNHSPSDCTFNERAVLALRRNGRDIFVLGRAHGDTWTASARRRECQSVCARMAGLGWQVQ